MFSNKFNAQYGGCYAISNGNYVTFRCQYWIQVFKVLLNPSRIFISFHLRYDIAHNLTKFIILKVHTQTLQVCNFTEINSFIYFFLIIYRF